MVSAFAARQRLVLGQVKVADKSNEIIAIPALLDMLAIEGAVVTIDAMGCQRDISQKIIDKKAHYILALKGNQGTLREDVEVFAAEQKANGFKDTKVSQHKTVDADYGPIETRTYTVIHDVDWLQDNHEWPGLKSVIMVESEHEIPATAKDPAKIEHETRSYITSLVWLVCQVAPAIRGHWMIENGLHWVMDMMFRDDECRVRTDNAPANFTTIKHMALNLIRLKSSGKKGSMKTRRFVASWDAEYVLISYYRISTRRNRSRPGHNEERPTRAAGHCGLTNPRRAPQLRDGADAKKGCGGLVVRRALEPSSVVRQYAAELLFALKDAAPHLSRCMAHVVPCFERPRESSSR
jgi:predicted transposase YbfD/YdcC